MSALHPQRPPLRLIRPDYVCESIAMLRQMDLDTILCYLLLIAREQQRLGMLTPFRLARVRRLTSHLMQEIKKAA